MKKRFLLATLLTSTLLLNAETNTTTAPIVQPIINKKQEGVKYIKILGATLKSNLQTQMQADKTGLSAMAFCTDKADALTQEVNTKLPEYAKVRRTALKTRNEANQPDTLDQSVMEQMIIDISNSKIPNEKPIMVETLNSYRVYKPLTMKPMCLKCHGGISDISSEIQKMITDKYPKDMATGFKLGELRGVIISEMQK